MAASWLRWWVASMLVWWLLTSTIKAQEALVGVGAAAIAATTMTVIRRGAGPLVRFRVNWLKPAGMCLLAFRDTLTLGAVLWRKVVKGRAARGSFEEVSMTAPRDDSHAAGKELLATLGISATPNTIVVGYNREREVLVVHQAVSRHPRSIQDLLSPR